ncbi:MAG: hypothetical protein KGI50_04680 [Patescibacteria group bacterium]|nr:hypothetical protein [Patescibacteria group bacterium]MDE2438667.1 hypothetical protein [Patescibacteria group bacterium]
MISERQSHILKFALDEYLRHNNATTSQLLFEEGNLALSSATLRYELARLDTMGYLFQSHTSGGRYPTNKALQWFLDEFVFDALNPDYYRVALEREFMAAHVDQRLFYHFANFAAAMCDAFCGVYVDEVGYQAGLSDLFSRLEVDSSAAAQDIIRDLEGIDTRLRRCAKRIFDGVTTQIFIGEESPITEHEDLAVLVMNIHGRNLSNRKKGFEGVAVLVGSKRMPYKRNISFLEASKHFFNSL